MEDEKHCYALLGFRYIDDIMEKEKAIQEQIQKAYEEVIESNEIISAIAKSYCHIYLMFLSEISIAPLLFVSIFLEYFCPSFYF